MSILPKYYKMERIGKTKYNIRIKRWGFPIIIFKGMKQVEHRKWYYWFLYPYICIKAMIMGLNGDG